jgi:hypothetical protein
MKFAGTFIALAVGAACLAPGWPVAGAAEADPPYAVIASRNVFGLLSLTNIAADEAAALAADLPKITPNGIMNLFGKQQVLFKVAAGKPTGKPQPGQPNNKDTSYVMCEGERQDEIEVVKINETDGVVTFNNHGTVQELPLVAANPSGPGPGGPGGPSGPGPGPHFSPARGGIPAPMGMGHHLNPAGRSAGEAPGSTGTPSLGGSASTTTTATPEEAIENQILNETRTEAQRAEWKAAGNPAAVIIPPTRLQNVLNPSEPENTP